MKTIQQKRDEAHERIAREARTHLEIMLDTIKQDGYYGHEWMKLFGNNGISTQIRKGSDTTHADPHQRGNA